jgi:hypothetical protein
MATDMRPATCESTVSMAGDRAVFNYPNRVFERHRIGSVRRECLDRMFDGYAPG